jgi:hypothetical protein
MRQSKQDEQNEVDRGLCFVVCSDSTSCYQTTLTILSVNRMKPCEPAVDLAFKLIIVSWNVTLS